MNVSFTRRGQIVAGVCILGIAMGIGIGGRSLNAVVVPGIVAIAAGYVQLTRIQTPSVRRNVPPDDFVGTTHQVGLSFHGADGGPVDSPFLARIHDTPDSGVRGPEQQPVTTVGAEPAKYVVEYTERGETALGPVTLIATDIFGLLERELFVTDRDSVLVYPNRRTVPSRFRRGLHEEGAVGESRQRDEFDRLREYARGDSLRDVHWATTAKGDEIVVKEFAAETERRRVHVSGGADTDADDDAIDELAEAVVSVALPLLEDGTPVTVSLPNGRIEAQPGHTGRRRVLELAARVDSRGGADPDADIVVTAGPSGTTIRAGDRSTEFATLIGGRSVRSPPGPDEPTRPRAVVAGGDR